MKKEIITEVSIKDVSMPYQFNVAFVVTSLSIIIPFFKDQPRLVAGVAFFGVAILALVGFLWNRALIHTVLTNRAIRNVNIKNSDEMAEVDRELKHLEQEYLGRKKGIKQVNTNEEVVVYIPVIVTLGLSFGIATIAGILNYWH